MASCPSLRALAVGGLIALNACGDESTPPSEAGPLANTIVFSAHGRLFAIAPNGTGLSPLSPDTASVDSPSISPDATQLAFVDGPGDGTSQIFVMKADGTDLRLVTDLPGGARRLAWSPDGSQIASVSVADGEGVTYVVNTDGTQAHVVAPDVSAFGVAWSPDGRRFALERAVDIVTVRTDGSDLEAVPGTQFGLEPAWSPDGEQIAFLGRDDQTGHRWIFVANVDGSGAHPVSGPAIGGPVWSPDGQRLAFVGLADANAALTIVDADGTGAYTLVAPGISPGYLSWGSDR